MLDEIGIYIEDIGFCSSILSPTAGCIKILVPNNTTIKNLIAVYSPDNILSTLTMDYILYIMNINFNF